jgi:hypothetical protein
MAAECTWSVVGGNQTILKVIYAVQNCFKGDLDDSEWFQRESGAIIMVSGTRNIWNIISVICQ